MPNHARGTDRPPGARAIAVLDARFLPFTTPPMSGVFSD
ncbi:hypothetical protein SAMN05421757_101845 [Tropicimonas sediminicola]|uniref:Uncharacterized protein n=1 Tax=Tropicimonas sediminicola TaxID=1031541 RepID=A0A239DKE0_9RHOB|nr:hypothetical protein SAMN05421757_101845 [Tropicimonas sediminicola]